MDVKGGPGREKTRQDSGPEDGPSYSDMDIVENAVVSDTEEHYLVDDEGELLHFWELDGVSFEEVPPARLSGSFKEQVARLEELKRWGRLRYQSMGSWDLCANMEELEGADPTELRLLRADGGTKIRLDTRNIRYIMNCRERPVLFGSGSNVLARLNNMENNSVPRLLGLSYWDLEEGPLVWMDMTASEASDASGFKPFLSDLDGIIVDFMDLEPSKARRYLVQLSRTREVGSLRSANALGEQIGTLHGDLVEKGGRNKRSREKGMAAAIKDLLTLGTFDMTSIGTYLGLYSSYISGIKKGLNRLLGDRCAVSVPTGRKMKVVKRRQRPRSDDKDLSNLTLLRQVMYRSEKRLRKKMVRLRRFSGAPSIHSGLDCRLDHLEMTGGERFLFNNFDWEMFGGGKGTGKIMPLKDLSMVLNSMKKARYLSSRRALGRFSEEKKMDRPSLELVFLDYNLAKRNYREMMKDHSVLGSLSDRESMLGAVHRISLVSALWYERIRNELVAGYSGKLTDIGREDLLSYPKGVDTVEGIRILQMLLSMSESSRALGDGNGKSSLVGLESDLLNIMTV